MDHSERVTALVHENVSTLSTRDPSILGDFPVERYLAAFDSLPPLAPYHSVPPEAESLCSGINERAGAEALEAYNRLAMLELIRRGLPRPGTRLTRELAELLDAYLQRILTDIGQPRKRFYRHGNDQFAKDFAVCRGKLIPGGVELIDCEAGIGRRSVLAGGLAEAPSRLAFFTLRMGGFKPFFELHFDRRLIGEFNAEGYAALYTRVADLLALHPQIRGVVSSSWWHDPRLEEISPEITFVDHHPKAAGARVMRSGENAVATADAIRFAPERAARYRQGEYRPCVYLLAWPRRDIIRWAREQRERP